MRSMSVSTCRCCMFVSCVHPVAVLNAAFCIICSVLMPVEDARAIWLNPFVTVLFTVCSSVTVECCVLYPCCVGVFSMLLCGSKEEGSSPVSL